MEEFDYKSAKVHLYTTNLSALTLEPTLIQNGAIVLCCSGDANLRIDFKTWKLYEGAAITLFPNDIAILQDASEDFFVKVLAFDPDLLREASLQLERTVYSSLRADRCRKDRPVVRSIITNLFNLLEVYFKEPGCTCLDQLVLLQLKAFFLGFYDYMYRHNDERPDDMGSRRVQDLFNRFMDILQENFKVSREVQHYADRLNISTKYLNTIVRQMTGLSTKVIIDHFVTMQLKLSLRTTSATVSSLAWEYHFGEPSILCKYFKQRAGMSPQQYRMEHRYRS